MRPFDEYKQATRLHRHETTLMFGQWVAYVAAMGLLLQKVVAECALANGLQRVAGVIGIVLTFVFWVVHERTSLHQRQASKRARQLERKLDFDLYRQRGGGAERAESTRTEGDSGEAEDPSLKKHACLRKMEDLILKSENWLLKPGTLRLRVCRRLFHAHTMIRFVFVLGAALSLLLLSVPWFVATFVAMIVALIVALLTVLWPDRPNKPAGTNQSSGCDKSRVSAESGESHESGKSGS